MVKRYSKKLCFLVIIFICAYGDEQKLYAICSSTAMKKLNEAFAHNSVTNLFVDEIGKVFSDDAINKNAINYTNYFALKSLFNCSSDLIQKNKDVLVHINADDYQQTRNKAYKFLKKLIKYSDQLKRRKITLETADSYYNNLSEYKDALKQFRKLALLDLLVYAPKEVAEGENKASNFAKYFKESNFQQFFNDYQKAFYNSGEKKTINNAKKSEVALEEFIKLNVDYQSKNRNEVAFVAFKYLDEFKKKASEYKAQLTKELKRSPSGLQKIFKRSKKGIQEKIEILKKYIDLVQSIQEALFETILYERPPLAFATHIEEANPGYRLILAETKALYYAYNKVSDYFLSVLKMLIKYNNE